MNNQDITCDSLFTYNGNHCVLYVIVGLNGLMILWLGWKIVKLYSQAFSYTNFHIHQTYKLYTIAIISFVLVILSRLAQATDDDKVMQGDCVWNQLIGTMSIYAVNMIYMLNGFTWLMISMEYDFTQVQEFRTPARSLRPTEYRKCVHRTRDILLYVGIPTIMLLSMWFIIQAVGQSSQAYVQVQDQSSSCPLFCWYSRILVNITSLIAMLLIVCPLVMLLKQRQDDESTERKVKLMWVYLILAIMLRGIWFIYYTIPSSRSNSDQQDQQVLSSVINLLYSIFLTILPILFLSYLSEKQFQKQRLQIIKAPMQVHFTSSIL